MEAVAARYPGKQIVACLELHTYSSLNIDFLPHYKGTLDKASMAIVYFSPHAIQMKKLQPLSPEKVKEAFGLQDLRIYDRSEDLFSFFKTEKFRDPVFLFMSSGDFDGYNLASISF